MKKIIFGLVVLFIGTQIMTSCSSESNVLSQFSKRKYMKRFKAKDLKYNDEINERENNFTAVEKVEERTYASSNTELTAVGLEDVNVLDNAKLVEPVVEERVVEEHMDIVEPLVDYSSTYRGVSQANSFSKNKFVNNFEGNKISNAREVNSVVLAILCIFIPPLAVYLYEDSITTNFWVDLVGTLLFWLPGIILAFLIVFAGVSF